MPVRIPRSSPFTTQFLVIGALMQREIQTKFGAYQLGFIWFFLQPLLGVLVMGILLGPFIGRSAPAMPYAFFLLNGFMLLGLFTAPMTVGMRALQSNQGLLVFPGVRPLDPYIARFVLEFVTTIFVFGIFCAIAMWMGIWISLDQLDILFYCFLLTWMIGCGFGLIFGVAAAYFNEVEQIVPVLQRPLMFISCVIHPAYTLPYSAKEILLKNPLVHTIELSRHALFPLYHLDGVNLLYPSVFAVSVLAAGLILFRGHSHYLMQR
jgi:capsular polysaccharide transport system permease protein